MPIASNSAAIAAPVPQIRLYLERLKATRDLEFAHYEDLHRWSVTDLEGFWRSIWDYDRIESRTPFSAMLGAERMPGARWCEGAEVSYARHVFRHAAAADSAEQPAIVAVNERGEQRTLGWAELRRQSASLALELRRRGVGRGDRVAAYLPNIAEAVVGLLACASLGAIWSLCSPDMGTNAVLDRLRQTEPKALIAVDGVFYAGKAMDRSACVAEICAALPCIEALFVIESGFGAGAVPARMATLRPSAVDPLFERNNGTSEGDRARARRGAAGNRSGATPFRSRTEL